jgi:hypothetical protein
MHHLWPQLRRYQNEKYYRTFLLIFRTVFCTDIVSLQPKYFVSFVVRLTLHCQMSCYSASESPQQRRSRPPLQPDSPAKKPPTKLWRKPGEPPSPQRYTTHSSIPRRANSRTRTPSLPSWYLLLLIKSFRSWRSTRQSSASVGERRSAGGVSFTCTLRTF